MTGLSEGDWREPTVCLNRRTGLTGLPYEANVPTVGQGRDAWDCRGRLTGKARGAP